MDKKYYIIGGVVFLLLIFVLGGFAAQKFLAKRVIATPTPSPEVILKLSPDDIGLTTAYVVHTKGSSSGPALKVSIIKVNDISAIDCSMEYSHSTPDGSRITEGVICGSGTNPNGQTFSQEVVFGTCSDVCHFHTDIQDVNLVLKITKNDGKVYDVEKKLDPPTQ